MRTDPQRFEPMYQGADDPWGFASSPYEVAKYDTTVASLGATHYDRCFEPACSIGALTERLATRADAIVACDVSSTAIDHARARLASVESRIELVTAVVPEWWPSGSFDLIVLSELGYYWDVTGWRDVIQRCRRSLRDDGELIAVHWLGSSPEHILDAATVHGELANQLGPSDLHLEQPVDSSGDGFLLDRWTGVRRD